MGPVSTTFPKGKLQVLTECIEGQKWDEFTVLRNRLWYTSRWSVHYELIFEHGSGIYRTSYSVGATENQDEVPFEYGPKDIEVTPVRSVWRTVLDYEDVPNDEE